MGLKKFVDVFKIVGCEIFIVSGKKEAASLIKRLVVEKNFALIFVTSSVANLIPKTIEKLSLNFAPLISQIPG